MNRYHRNSMLAFPKTAEYGCAIERTTPKADIATAILIGIGLAMALIGWWAA